eukprot:TRINITY_DN4165_c0_g1_i7.p1 TRINITY_DN4165_c0_g1~~TRINITY_DN4165_c0_g1_i7.p1  ORF type:complete len:365 (-),score=41.20 TRINITY_DN4165_c0_g1_i7:551-1645(-)
MQRARKYFVAKKATFRRLKNKPLLEKITKTMKVPYVQFVLKITKIPGKVYTKKHQNRAIKFQIPKSVSHAWTFGYYDNDSIYDLKECFFCRVRYPLEDESTRRYFEVLNDPQHPFSVYTDPKDIFKWMKQNSLCFSPGLRDLSLEIQVGNELLCEGMLRISQAIASLAKLQRLSLWFTKSTGLSKFSLPNNAWDLRELNLSFVDAKGLKRREIKQIFKLAANALKLRKFSFTLNNTSWHVVDPIKVVPLRPTLTHFKFEICKANFPPETVMKILESVSKSRRLKSFDVNSQGDWITNYEFGVMAKYIYQIVSDLTLLDTLKLSLSRKCDEIYEIKIKLPQTLRILDFELMEFAFPSVEFTNIQM